MDISDDEIHPHCAKCYRIQKCSAALQRDASCPIVSCPLACGARFHACKSKEHDLLCMNVKVPCINAGYGCPARMSRKLRGQHLLSCPASVIHCCAEWDRWPIHFHDKRLRFKYKLDPSLTRDLDISLAMRDERMLQRWFLAASEGRDLTSQKFTISPSSSLWIFRKWKNSREYSYPPGLEQSVCNELCKACKNKTGEYCRNGADAHSDSSHDGHSMELDSNAEKENAGDSNNKQERTGSSLIIPANPDTPLKPTKPAERSTSLLSFPEYNLEDILQLSQFGTIIHHTGTGEESIRVAVDPADLFSSHCTSQQRTCQFLDFKFKNPSSTPPWCLPLGLDLNLEPRSQHPPSNFMYTFLCGQEFRRDEYDWHHKNCHSEIHGGLNGWLVERCPLAQYGCKFSRQRFQPFPASTFLVFNETLESFGVGSKVGILEKSDNNGNPSVNIGSHQSIQNGWHDLNLVELPYEVLQHIVKFLDSFSLANLSLTSTLLRNVCSSVLKDRGLVHFKYVKHSVNGKETWKPVKLWFFSAHFSPIHRWTFSDQNSMANHLRQCPFYHRNVQKQSFSYTKGPNHVHPGPDKCFSDPSRENSESTTKL